KITPLSYSLPRSALGLFSRSSRRPLLIGGRGSREKSRTRGRNGTNTRDGGAWRKRSFTPRGSGVTSPTALRMRTCRPGPTTPTPNKPLRREGFSYVHTQLKRGSAMGFSPLAKGRRIPDIGRSSVRQSKIRGFTIHHQAGV